jgi:hypothetical protein
MDKIVEEPTTTNNIGLLHPMYLNPKQRKDNTYSMSQFNFHIILISYLLL